MRISSLFVTGLVFAAIAAVAIVDLAGARTAAIIIAGASIGAVAVYFVSTRIGVAQNRTKP